MLCSASQGCQGSCGILLVRTLVIRGGMVKTLALYSKGQWFEPPVQEIFHSNSGFQPLPHNETRQWLTVFTSVV